MSLPTFSFSTTADEVATVFADQIKGKNGFENYYAHLPSYVSDYSNPQS